MMDIILKKRRVGVMERYGLGPVVLQYVMLYSKTHTWPQITNMLEDYVLDKYGVEIKLYHPNVLNYYKKVAKGGLFENLDDPNNFRREAGEEWLRSLKAVYDTCADIKVLLDHCYEERNARDYATLVKSLHDMMRLLAEIHNNSNYNVVVKEKMVAVVHGIIALIKDYDFEQLKDMKPCALEVITDSGHRRVSDSKIVEIKHDLLKYIVSNLPQVSDVFVSTEKKPVETTDVIVPEKTKVMDDLPEDATERVKALRNEWEG